LFGPILYLKTKKDSGIMSKILLSICIPTYNRCTVLDDTLKTLFSNPEFDSNRIEVIVSDNSSTDHTQEIVAKYPLVRYYCNAENVKDRNFALVLGYATGRYIKLFNDTLSFKPNALGKLLDRIEKQMDSNVNLFFYSNMFLNSDCQKTFDSVESYFKEVSYYSTAIANFGVWRDDFLKIKDKERYAVLQFTQVDWSYKIVKNGKKSVIYFDDLFEVVTPNKKGGYNIFDTFINNYLFIVKQEKLAMFNYELEKFRLLWHFVYPWLITLTVANKSNYSFDTKGVFNIILKKYWYEPYFYVMLILWFKKSVK
jgi:glycosyltransferase involved in cell wall biosynthesis